MCSPTGSHADDDPTVFSWPSPARLLRSMRWPQGCLKGLLAGLLVVALAGASLGVFYELGFDEQSEVSRQKINPEAFRVLKGHFRRFCSKVALKLCKN